ncbi:RHS repeat-associated core domain-containing protein [Streptomyces similanensis]
MSAMIWSGYNYVAPNDQATGTTSLNSTAQTPTFRLFDPCGNQPATRPGDKGFVGGTQDQTTNLTHLGARDYDPTLGRFISKVEDIRGGGGGYHHVPDHPSDSTSGTGHRSGNGSPVPRNRAEPVWSEWACAVPLPRTPARSPRNG